MQPRAAAFLLAPKAMSFCVGRRKIIVASGSGLWAWRKRLFIFTLSATEYYQIKISGVIELGGQATT